MKLVSVIIVNWNGVKLIASCLEALQAQTYHAMEIILVDNGSTDGSAEFVRQYFPGVTLIQSESNLGFSGGNNLGLKYAHGDHIALLNNDAVPTKKWLEYLVNGIEEENVGICASNILVFGTDFIDSAGDGCTTVAAGYKRGEGERALNFFSATDVFGACAGAALYKRELIDDIGFFDDDFFLIHEDTDLNFRARLAGWRCKFAPAAVVYHKVRSSIGNMSDMAVYYSNRNVEMVWIKNMPFLLMLKYLHHKLIMEMGSFFYFCLKHGKWKPFFLAKVDALRLLPGMLQKRKMIQKRVRIKRAELSKLLTPVLSINYLQLKYTKFFNH